MAQGDEVPSNPALALDDEPEDPSSIEEGDGGGEGENAGEPQEPAEAANALPPAPGEELLFDDAITRVIRAVLRHVGCGDHEMDLLVDEVRMQALISGRRKAKNGVVLGNEPKRWKGLARVTARNFGLNWREKEKVRREAMIKLAPDGQSVAPPRSEGGMDPIDQKKAIGVYQRMKRHPKADDMLDATRTGEGPSEAARQEGLNPKQGHKILEKTRSGYVKALRIASLAVLLPSGVALALLWLRGTPVYPWDLEGPDHTAARMEQGHVTKELGGEDDPDSLRQRATELRRKAAEECKAGQVVQCRDDLHEADRIDPDHSSGGTLAPQTSAKPGW